jgi:hypothetical protein
MFRFFLKNCPQFLAQAILAGAILIGGLTCPRLWARMFGDMRRLYAWREQLQEFSCSVKSGPLDFYIPLDAQLPETKGGASCSSKSVCLCVDERERVCARANERDVTQARSSRVACRGHSTELCAWLMMDDCPQANRRLRTMGGGNRPCGKSTMYVLICLPQCVMPLSVYHLSFITSAHFSHAVEWVCVRTYLCVYARVLWFLDRT